MYLTLGVKLKDKRVGRVASSVVRSDVAASIAIGTASRRDTKKSKYIDGTY